jgi:hypothetical protein
MRGLVRDWRGGARARIPDAGWVDELARLWRAYGRLAVPLAIVIITVGIVRATLMFAEAARQPGAIGIDLVTATDAARRWLDGSSPYLARQLSGPYDLIGANTVDSGEMLYPPVALPLFAPFLALPAVLWWAIPGVLCALGLRKARPARAAWPVIALFLSAGQSIPLIIAGNPTIWVVAGALWAPSLGWPGPLLLFKPTVAPLALLGIRRRSWWIAAVLLGIASLGFGSLWADWFRAIWNMRAPGAGGILYSVQQLPILLIPVIVAVAARPTATRGAGVLSDPPPPVRGPSAPMGTRP